MQWFSGCLGSEASPFVLQEQAVALIALARVSVEAAAGKEEFVGICYLLAFSNRSSLDLESR